MPLLSHFSFIYTFFLVILNPSVFPILILNLQNPYKIYYFGSHRLDYTTREIYTVIDLNTFFPIQMTSILSGKPAVILSVLTVEP